MKKIIITALAVFAFGFTNAQDGKFEAKINPLGALFGNPDISGEYIVNDNFGVELSIGFAFGTVTGISIDGADKPTQSGLGFKLAGKYYFNPDQGADGWYGDVYLRQESLTIAYSGKYNNNDYKSAIFAGGIEFGKKWVFDSGILIDIAAGVGRPFSESRTFSNSSSSNSDLKVEIGIDFTGKFAVGYRF